MILKKKDLIPIYGAFVVNEDDFLYAINEIELSSHLNAQDTSNASIAI